jgi:hypothetical protein
VILKRVFCLVELTRLELVTPCLQNPARVSGTVPGLGLVGSLVRRRAPASGVVGVSRGCQIAAQRIPSTPVMTIWSVEIYTHTV